MSSEEMTAEAERHRRYAARFVEVVSGVTDWGAPTPVKEWAARDVVAHLIDWFPSFLEAGTGIVLPAVPSPDADPAGAWDARRADVQALLDDPDTAGGSYRSRMFGELTVAEAIDRFYTTDIFMHTWDLARSAGLDDTLDEAVCTEMLAGMEQVSEVIRSSGQFGDQQDVPAESSAQQRLIAFIGRDPLWRPESG